VYERDGAVRRSWYDPVGWADLHTVPTPTERTTYLAQRSQELRAIIEQSDAAIRDLSERLLAMGAEIEALKGHPHLKSVFDARRERIAQLAAELDQRRRRAAEDGAALDALECHRQAWPEGRRVTSRDHIQRAQRPATGAELRLGRLAEGWAAVSIGLMMVGVVALVIFAQDYLAEGLTVMLAFLVVVEASFRRRLTRILGSAAVALAVLAGLILLYEFFWQTVVAVVLFAGAYIIIENVRELVA
jgi:chromosome segregation ATPase